MKSQSRSWTRSCQDGIYTSALFSSVSFFSVFVLVRAARGQTSTYTLLEETNLMFSCVSPCSSQRGENVGMNDSWHTTLSRYKHARTEIAPVQNINTRMRLATKGLSSWRSRRKRQAEAARFLDIDGGSDRTEADVGVDDAPVWLLISSHSSSSCDAKVETHELGNSASTSEGTPLSGEQGPRSAPGWPAFSGG